MEKIITITLNPSIDKTTATDKVVPEKKLRCIHPTYEPGGGGINVSRALIHMDCKSIAMHFAGGYSGNFFKKLLHKENVESIAIPVLANMRTNIIIYEKSTGLQYRFGMVSEAVQERDWKVFLKRLEVQEGYEYVVASGSLPDGVPADFFGKVAAIVKKKNAKLIIDTSGEALKHAVKEGVYLIKPNISELSNLYGKENLQKEEVLIAARSIIQQGGCEIMVVSMGKEGAMLISADKSFQVTAPEVTVKSTVGAGDSMVAGMVLAVSKGWELEEVLKYGIACGTAATINAGTALCSKEDVERIYGILKDQPVIPVS
jgi:6-phosphofructokinase 2